VRNSVRAPSLRQPVEAERGPVGGYWWRNHIRHWRAVAGLSLSEAARRIGCSKAHLHDLESGRSANPSIALLRGIAETYGRGLMEVAYYAAGLGEKPSEGTQDGAS
jgi:DNA-binding XRE family transcriptional regulator